MLYAQAASISANSSGLSASYRYLRSLDGVAGNEETSELGVDERLRVKNE